MSGGAIVIIGMLCTIFIGCVAGWMLHAIKRNDWVIFGSLLALFVVSVIVFARLGFVTFASHLARTP